MAMLALGTVLLSAGLAESSGTGAEVRNGGTFRISTLSGDFGFDHVDPLPASAGSATVLQATCAHLMNFRDARLPEGLRIVPELAAGPPRVSRDGRAYTFTLRSGQRFSNGAPVTPRAFTRAIARARALGSASSDLRFAEEIAAARARGRMLVIRLRRPIPDFPARLAVSFCAVPPGLPADPEGAAAPLHSPAPYYVSEFLRGRRAVLRRNRFYRGIRPQHVDRFVVDFANTSGEVIADVERGRADWGWVPPSDYSRAAASSSANTASTGPASGSSRVCFCAASSSTRRGRCSGTTFVCAVRSTSRPTGRHCFGLVATSPGVRQTST